MENITRGHFLFAAIALIAFAVVMVVAYRKDLKKIGVHYKKAWMIVLGIAVIYFLIVMLNRVL
ncbi:MAG TPA: hypothetical protein VKY29_03605 [Cryomorphaceae bacterium]|nr:hypothetical protein [Cryomorphaceae bacterium]